MAGAPGNRLLFANVTGAEGLVWFAEHLFAGDDAVASLRLDQNGANHRRQQIHPIERTTTCHGGTSRRRLRQSGQHRSRQTGTEASATGQTVGDAGSSLWIQGTLGAVLPKISAGQDATGKTGHGRLPASFVTEIREALIADTALPTLTPPPWIT